MGLEKTDGQPAQWLWPRPGPPLSSWAGRRCSESNPTPGSGRLSHTAHWGGFELWLHAVRRDLCPSWGPCWEKTLEVWPATFTGQILFQRSSLGREGNESLHTLPSAQGPPTASESQDWVESYQCIPLSTGNRSLISGNSEILASPSHLILRGQHE